MTILEQVIINVRNSEKRFAYLKGNKVEKLYVQPVQQESTVGNIYLGLVTKVIPGMNAAFVNIGEEKAGYLSKEKLLSYQLDSRAVAEKKNSSISSFVRQGERVLVQVVKDAAGSKGAKLTGILEMSSIHLVYMPFGRYIAVSKKLNDPAEEQKLRDLGKNLIEHDEGLIFRTSAAKCTEEVLQEELAALREVYKKLEKEASLEKKVVKLKENNEFEKELHNILNRLSEGEVVVDSLEDKNQLAALYPRLTFSLHRNSEGIFAVYHIEKEIAKALKRVVWLENGAYLIIDQAEAATIIDVNTGKYEGKQSLEYTVLATNKLAAVEAIRQIKLRDLSGIILIDFIDMPAANQRKIQELLVEELKKDNKQTKLLGFTSLGIMQMTRKKTVKSLTETMQSTCNVCEGTGRVFRAESVAFQLERALWEYRHSDYERIEIEATKDVITIFSGEKNSHKLRMEEMLGMGIQFTEKKFAKPSYYIKYVGMKES